MQVIEVKDQKVWDEFIVSNGNQFLQSWEWAEFQKKLGRKIWRLGIKHDNNIVWQALLVRHKLPLGKSYLYCPRGPVVRSNYRDPTPIVNLFFERMKGLAKQENDIFFRFESLMDLRFANHDLKKIKDVQPSQTLILDLAQSEDKILSQMHEKTRYNIRLAQRRGVEIKQSKDINIFLNLIHQTAKREKFKPHPDIYYHKLLNVNSQFTNLYTAIYKERVLAAHIMIFFGNTAVYVHGASSREYKNVMAPHLLHWHTIKQAKRLGCQLYDFWGINGKKWPGLTRFKKGFGGHVVAYPGTFDIPVNNFWYQLYKIGTSCRSYLQ